MTLQKITPNLWFADRAEEAANFYASVFKDSKVGTPTHYDKASAEVSGMKEGEVLTVPFTIAGQDFLALNGGPVFHFTEAVSFIIDCKDQEEVDYFWNALTADGGQESVCGWLKDKFGLSWQVTPRVLTEAMIESADSPTKERVMKAMLKMKKIDVAAIERARDGE
ncbi:MAG: 3-demethylubiquinone-9 3-methyltransferase [Parcubacteria bacterium C7867-004]|nr:MAG: 3-demethylubiquinone-9 3-methyltransferase [Parcubacteria bacterium C7867-004]